MTDAIGSVAHALLASIALFVGLQPGAVTLCAALMLATALILAAIHALALPASGRVSPVQPRRAIDVSVTVSQSDPDAAGHPRSRAPGFAASAA